MSGDRLVSVSGGLIPRSGANNVDIELRAWGANRLVEITILDASKPSRRTVCCSTSLPVSVNTLRLGPQRVDSNGFLRLSLPLLTTFAPKGDWELRVKRLGEPDSAAVVRTFRVQK